MPFTFMKHNESGEMWAARTEEAGRVRAICGPLAPYEISDSRLPDYAYREDERELADFNAHREEFTVGLVPDVAEPA